MQDVMNEALSLFLHKLRCPIGLKPEYQVFAAILKSCATISDVRLGKSLHSHVLKKGHNSCLSVSKSLLNLYAKSKAFDDCHKLFGQINHCDAVTWNIFLSGFSGSRNHDIEVMRLFYAMHIGDDPKPNSVTIAIILPVCARTGVLGAAKSVHSYVIRSGLDSHTLVSNALLSMYAKSGHVCDDAHKVFERIANKDVVSWNAIIAGFVENNFTGDAFELFRNMVKGPILPNYATIANVLPICSFLEENVAYQFGKEIHCYALRRAELAEDVSITNALVSFYSKIGKMGEAESLFRRMELRDLVTWNSMIGGCTSNSEWSKALEFFHELLSIEIGGPDSVTLISILPACAQLYNLRVGREIHGHIIRNPRLLEDTSVGNALVSFYSKCSDIEYAYRTFLLICKKDLISWNAMLDAFLESQLQTQFVNLFMWMLEEGIKPDSITILSIVQFCATISRVDKVKEAHGFSIKSGILPCDFEPTLGNAIIDAYAKCGKMEYALKIFESLSGKRNVVTCNSVISGYINYGSHDDAHMIFTRMPEKDLTTWNLMIRVYAENDCPSQALVLFHELHNHGMKPDAMTIMSFLPVCAQMTSAHLLKQCHVYVIRSCLEDVRLKGALLDIYSKCGSINSAYRLFISTPEKDLVLFTAMVGGYAMHGMAKEALEVFYYMLESGLKPDHVIITTVLSACSHAGLVNEGLKIFYSIEMVHGIKPTMEQYSCVVDLLARGGRIKDAYSFVTKMPIEASPSVWGTLLGACRTHHEVEMGRAVADHLFEVETSNIGNYVVMSNLYAANGRWDGVLEMRKLMRERDLKKPAGCSWIEVERTKTVFIAGDSSHSQRSIIYGILRSLDQQIKDPFLS